MDASSFLACGAPSRRDLAIAASMPVAAVVPDGPFAPLEGNGRRLLISGSGVLIEARSPALHLLLPLVEGEVPAYGPIEPFIRLRHGHLPMTVWDGLAAAAREACPNEMAALVLAGQGWSGYEVLRPESSAHHASVTYDDTGYPEGSLVLDVHSHGRFDAVFSRTDAISDVSRGGPHISLVFGACAQDQTLQFSARACIGSCLIPLDPETVMGFFA